MLKRVTGTQEALGAGKGPVLMGLGNEKLALDKQSQASGQVNGVRKRQTNHHLQNHSHVY